MQPRETQDLPHRTGMTQLRLVTRGLAAFVGACAVVVVLAGGISIAFFPASRKVIDLQSGKRIFAARCASCHSLEEAAGPRYGPSLHRIGREGGNRIDGMDAEEYIFQSIVDPSAYQAPGSTGVMPENAANGLSDDDLLSLTAFLCQQGGSVRYSNLLQLPNKIPRRMAAGSVDLELDSVERGRKLFLGKLNCAKCHSLDPIPGSDLLAPTLATAGRHSRSYLEEKLLSPSKHITPGYEFWTATISGVSHSGRRLPAPAGMTRLLISDGDDIRVRDFKDDKLDREDDGPALYRSGVSPMPPCDGAVSKEERDAVLDFLTTLR